MSVRTRTLKLLAPLAASGLLLCAAQATVGAQRATVTLRATDHSASVRGAVISLLSQDGRTVAEALSIENGARTLEAPVPGTYRIRVRRIGYVPFVSQPIVLAAGETARINLELPLSRVNLATMHIRSTFKSCGGGFGGDQATSITWDQIRTALSADVLTERDTLVKLNVRHFVTRERPNGEPYALEVKELGESGAQPFGTADPAALSRSGYVVRQVSGTTYWAPDPHVLLSPEFEREHCFRLITRHDSAGEQIGLAFEPTSDRDLADIRGTLWVRRADSHLQRLEYRYANTSPPLGATNVGGEVEFTSLPSGVWYIASWSVRLPLITDNPIDPSRPRFVGYKKVGGVATPVGSTVVLPLNLRSAPPAAVVGARVVVHVMDQATDSAIDGAVVDLQNGAASRLSDSTGMARFPAISQGTTHIRVRQIGFQPVDTSIVVRGDSLIVTVALARIATRMATVHISADRARQFMAAFDRRRTLGVGRFLTDSVFKREAWRSLATVLVTHYGGLKLVPIVTGSDDLNDPVDQERFGAMRLEATQPSGILKDTKPTCPIDTYFDGTLFREDVDAIPTDIVGGAELYDKASAPPEYRRAGKACKVLLIWTRAR